jgi:hypothetical protein
MMKSWSALILSLVENKNSIKRAHWLPVLAADTEMPEALASFAKVLS